MTGANIQSSAVLNVASEHTGETYRISVALPMSYFSDPDAVFPVVYMVDANLEFEAVLGMARLMQMSSVVPEFAVVGIGYPLEGNFGDGLEEFGRRRARDLTSAVDERYGQFVTQAFGVEGTVATGGSKQFLGFIADELLPVVEAQYRFDPDDRTLLGHSAGGQFTNRYAAGGAAEAMLAPTRPDLAFRYVVANPSSYLYFSAERAKAGTLDEFAARHACRDDPRDDLDALRPQVRDLPENSGRQLADDRLILDPETQIDLFQQVVGWPSLLDELRGFHLGQCMIEFSEGHDQSFLSSTTVSHASNLGIAPMTHDDTPASSHHPGIRLRCLHERATRPRHLTGFNDRTELAQWKPAARYRFSAG